MFHYFARSTKASQVAFLNGAPEEGIFEPIRQYIEVRGGKILIETKVQELILNDKDEVSGLKLADDSIFEADVYLLAAPLHSTRQFTQLSIF